MADIDPYSSSSQVHDLITHRRRRLHLRWIDWCHGTTSLGSLDPAAGPTQSAIANVDRSTHHRFFYPHLQRLRTVSPSLRALPSRSRPDGRDRNRPGNRATEEVCGAAGEGGLSVMVRQIRPQPSLSPASTLLG